MSEQLRSTQDEAELRWLLKEQVLLAGVEAAADGLASILKLSEFPEGKQIYAEGEPYHRTLYLLLKGKVDLYWKGNRIASLERRQFFGEFPLLDISARYSVTVQVSESAYIATVDWTDFARVADRYPRVWRNLASELASRLRSSRPLAPAAKPSEDPKSVQEAIVRLAWSLPTTLRVVVGVLVALCVAAYFVWSSLSEADRAMLTGSQPKSHAPPSASAASN